jgi:hypothetical protein
MIHICRSSFYVMIMFLKIVAGLLIDQNGVCQTNWLVLVVLSIIRIKTKVLITHTQAMHIHTHQYFKFFVNPNFCTK